MVMKAFLEEIFTMVFHVLLGGDRYEYIYT
jgi:hypothetical protein